MHVCMWYIFTHGVVNVEARSILALPAMLARCDLAVRCLCVLNVDGKCPRSCFNKSSLAHDKILKQGVAFVEEIVLLKNALKNTASLFISHFT